MRIFKLLTVVFLSLSFANVTFAASNSISPKQADTTLQQIKTNLGTVFANLDTDVAKSAAQLSNLGLTGKPTDEVLNRLYQSNPEIISVSTVNNNGMIVANEPNKFNAVGADISKQAHVIQILKTHAPVFSVIFKSVEGPWAVTIHHPIFNQQKEFLGSVALLFAPELMLNTVINKIEPKPANFDILALQTDGSVVYSNDKNAIGKVVFNDSYFKNNPGLAETAKKIVKEKTGFGVYPVNDQASGKILIKKIIWTTSTFYGIEWRLAVIW